MSQYVPNTRMKKTPQGTSVGVDDPYEHAGHCDHLTDDGRCRFAVERFEADPAFARARRDDDYRCPVVDPAGEWGPQDCPNFQSTASDRECARCGLEERRIAHDDDHPLLEEHHLSYPEGDLPHEITVVLCRWCHATVHDSWGSIADDVGPDPEALAELEGRRAREQSELSFESAAKRYDSMDSDGDQDQRRKR